MPRRAACALVLLLPLLVFGQSLPQRIESIINSSPEGKQAFWGIRVVNLKTGTVVYRRNDRHFFIPASNTKLFSTAAALMRLGPDYQFHTTVMADAGPDSSGRIRGDLRLTGGGDPNLSARVVPYQHEEFTGNPLKAIDELADQIAAQGIRQIDGNVIGDDTRYLWEPYPAGWAADDAIYEYGAPVSALTLNDNAFTLYVNPGLEECEPAVLSLWPAIEHLTIHNRIRTTSGGERELEFHRMPGSHELIASGTIPEGNPPHKILLAVDDPALFAAQALMAALQKRGIVVKGTAAARHRRFDDTELTPAGGTELARFSSQPLKEALRVINKVSQNLHAEMLIRELAWVRTGTGSREEGVKEMENFLTEIGVEPDQYNFEDGSGLSRLTLATPETVSKLLIFLYNSPHRELWTSLLPIGATDGTLDDRFKNVRAARYVHAKTGTISHVSALSGYTLPPGGRSYAFSVLVNNHNTTSSKIRALIDKIVLLLVKQS
ncbi:MAG: D-alanyl-D-alanine carboxypeptidase/D-alanyl-D-alanine endopeptidase [Bryobacteraceae bacterium]